MGCDIHMYAEVRKKGSDEWEAIGRIFKNSWSREDGVVTIDEDGYAFGEPLSLHPYDTRNYDLFGILADVRNGTWGESLEPISQPKGLPKDVSKYVKKRAKKWGQDGHSHSWLSLKELLGYNWKQKVKRSAYVSKEQADDYKKRGKKPTSYSAWSNYGIILEWEDELSENQKWFCTETMPKLKKLEKFGEVRIVFWFDN